MYAKAGSPMKQEKGMIRKWVMNTGMKNPNDFHPSLSYDKHLKDSIDLQPGASP
jgi:hypothetical protein